MLYYLLLKSSSLASEKTGWKPEQREIQKDTTFTPKELPSGLCSRPAAFHMASPGSSLHSHTQALGVISHIAGMGPKRGFLTLTPGFLPIWDSIHRPYIGNAQDHLMFCGDKSIYIRDLFSPPQLICAQQVAG